MMNKMKITNKIIVSVKSNFKKLLDSCFSNLGANSITESKNLKNFFNNK